MSESPLLTAFAAAQAVLGARAFTRMSGAFSACRIERAGSPPPDAGTIAAIVPVLDESRRVAGVLTGLIAQGPWLREILVVDGGSADHTLEIVRWFSERDARVRAIEAPARPPGWNGKIWNLQTGLNAADPANAWILTLDADVLPTADLSASLLTFAVDQHLDALSLATKQQLPDPWLGPVHGAMLATLVYRFGAPGRRATSTADVLANGQCFLARRAVLERTGAFAAAASSRCEDVTTARALVDAAYAVGFYEDDAGDPGLAGVRMYETAGDAWENWPRSLPMNDAYTSRAQLALQLAEVALLQALPLAVVSLLACNPAARRSFFYRVNLALLAARLGLTAGLSRAYDPLPPAYWLSPLADIPVSVRLISAAMQRNWTWRGVELVKDTR